ncbi:MAG: hypothetical protein ABW185_28830 [Sedimenticola sp.]
MAEAVEYSEDEVKALVESFKAIGVKPKADTPEALKAWMTDLVASGRISSKVDPTPHLGPTPPYAYVPKLSYFSGTSKDTDYDIWKYEVQSMSNDHLYSESIVMQAIRRAVKGEAARVLMHMGFSRSVREILDKFDSCFGFVQEGQTILAAFYNARQAEGEDVATFATKLEHMCNKAMRLGKVHPSQVDEMLKSALRTGINHDLRVLAGVKFELCRDFDTLRSELRKLELECNQQKAHCSSVSKTPPSSKDQRDTAIEKLTGMMKEMQKDVAALKSSHDTDTHVFSQQDQSQHQRGRGQSRPNFYDRGGQRSYDRGDQQRQQANHPPPTVGEYEEFQSYGDEIICYRCGQPGHVQYGCRVILDHQRRGGRDRYQRPSNSRGLMGRGRP